MLAELLIALALWAGASPLIWSLSLHSFQKTVTSFRNFERARLAKSALFWIFATQAESTESTQGWGQGRNERSASLIPSIESGHEIFSWGHYDRSGLTKRHKRQRELKYLGEGTLVGTDARGGHIDKSMQAIKKNTPYRLYCNSYRIEQMPASPSKKNPVWKRLACLELAVVFEKEELPVMHHGSILGSVLPSGAEETEIVVPQESLHKKDLKTAIDRFNKSFYSYFTLLRQKNASV